LPPCCFAARCTACQISEAIPNSCTTRLLDSSCPSGSPVPPKAVSSSLRPLRLCGEGPFPRLLTPAPAPPAPRLPLRPPGSSSSPP
jgi:hypothetical protein